MCTYGLHNCSRWRVILKWAFEGWRTGGFCLKVRASPFNEGLLFDSTVPGTLHYRNSFLTSFSTIFMAEVWICRVSGGIKEFLPDLESGYWNQIFHSPISWSESRPHSFWKRNYSLKLFFLSEYVRYSKIWAKHNFSGTRIRQFSRTRHGSVLFEKQVLISLKTGPDFNNLTLIGPPFGFRN